MCVGGFLSTAFLRIALVMHSAIQSPVRFVHDHAKWYVESVIVRVAIQRAKKAISRQQRRAKKRETTHQTSNNDAEKVMMNKDGQVQAPSQGQGVVEQWRAGRAAPACYTHYRAVVVAVCVCAGAAFMYVYGRRLRSLLQTAVRAAFAYARPRALLTAPPLPA